VVTAAGLLTAAPAVAEDASPTTPQTDKSVDRSAAAATTPPAPASTSSGVSATTPSPEAKKEDKPLRFGGAGLELSLFDGSGLNAVGENYQNSWGLYVGPSWKVGQALFKDIDALKGLTLSGRFILSGEFVGTGDQFRTGNQTSSGYFNGCGGASVTANGTVNGNTVPYCQDGSSRRLDYSDITIKLADKVYVIPVAEIAISAGLASAIPVSAESRYVNLITTLQPQVGFSRAFFDGKLTATYGFGFTKFFYSKSTPTVQYGSDPILDPQNPQLTAPGGTTVSTEGDVSRFAVGAGGLAPSYSVLHQFVLSYAPTEKLSFSALYIISDTFKQTNGNGCSYNFGGATGTVDVCSGSNNVAANAGATLLNRGDSGSQVFRLSAGYQLNDYLGAELSMLTASPQRHPDGSWQQPFYTANYNNYSSLSLSVSLTTEALAESLLYPSK
jgi:hypothetical protein